MRQGNILVSNSDFNRKRGELYLSQSSDAIISSNNIASKNHVGGGQLSSVHEQSDRSDCEFYSQLGCESYDERPLSFERNGGEGKLGDAFMDASQMTSVLSDVTIANADTSVSVTQVTGCELVSRPLMLFRNSDTGSDSFWDVDASSRPSVGGGGEKQYSHLFRKGASRLIGRCVATSAGLFRRNLDVSFMRMSLLLLGHEIKSLRLEVADN